MRFMRGACLVLLWLGWAGSARAAPPVASATGSEVVTVGEVATYDASASFDLDGDPLRFRWDFDDGEAAEGARVTHTFEAPGRYRVRVTVDDGTTAVEAGVTTDALAPIGAPTAVSRPLASWRGAVVVHVPARRAAVVVGPEGAATELPLQDVRAVAADGETLWVATGAELVRWDGTARVPFADATSVALWRGVLYAYASDRGALLVVDGDADTRAEVPAGGGPLGVDADGRVWIARALSPHPELHGQVWRVGADGHVETFHVRYDESADTASSGGGVPNLLGALAFEPSSTRLFVGGLKSNTERGLALDGRALTPENRVRALVATLDATVDVGADADAADLDERLDANDAGLVSALAFDAGGRLLFTAHPGVGEVRVYETLALDRAGSAPGATIPFSARVFVGDTPDGLLRMDDRLHVRLRESLELVTLRLAPGEPPVIERRVRLGDDPRSPEVAEGARWFHTSREPIASRGGYVACAHCHPGGGHDGRTWDFTDAGEGLRNTIDLRGRGGLAAGALHWSANFDEVQDFENDIVHHFGGTGLAMDGAPPNAPLGPPNAGRSAALDALAAYVSSLDAAPAPPTLSNARTVRRGRRLFFSAEVGCADCHGGPRYTDSQSPPVLHDVGTLRPSSGARLGEALTGLDTPSLLGVWQSAPYLHDGRAATLRAVLTDHNPDDAHGRTSHLDPASIDALVAFLETLHAPRAEPANGCRVGARSHAPTLAWLLFVWALRPRRGGAGAR